MNVRGGTVYWKRIDVALLCRSKLDRSGDLFHQQRAREGDAVNMFSKDWFLCDHSDPKHNVINVNTKGSAGNACLNLTLTPSGQARPDLGHWETFDFR